MNKDNQLEAPFLDRVAALRETIRRAGTRNSMARADRLSWLRNKPERGPQLSWGTAPHHGAAVIGEREWEDLDRLVRDTNRLRHRVSDLVKAVHSGKVTILDRESKGGPQDAVALDDVRKVVRAEIDERLTPVLETFLQALQHVRRSTGTSTAPRLSGTAHVDDSDDIDLPRFLKAPATEDEVPDASPEKGERTRRRWR